MGTNATGKTSLGRALAKIFSYLNSGNSSLLLDMETAGITREDRRKTGLDWLDDLADKDDLMYVYYREAVEETEQ